jgi:hypothetical protein
MNNIQEKEYWELSDIINKLDDIKDRRIPANTKDESQIEIYWLLENAKNLIKSALTRYKTNE